MLTLRSILCPVDFSDQSQHALRWALAIAAQYHSRLTVLNAVDPLLAQAAKARLGVDLPTAETEPALREFVKAALPAHASWPPDHRIDVRVGEPTEVILEAAVREQADLIAMGTQGIGGLKKLLLGSTTEEVLRRTPVPLLAVPPMDEQTAVLDPAEPALTIKTILMATDFGPASVNAEEWAADLARQRGVRLVFVHVVASAELAPPSQSGVGDVDDRHAAGARARLEELSARLAGGLERDIAVGLGQPADAIASIAEERQADLIVMGRPSREGILAPQPGSIAYRVICVARVPVLVVPPRGHS